MRVCEFLCAFDVKVLEQHVGNSCTTRAPCCMCLSMCWAQCCSVPVCLEILMKIQYIETCNSCLMGYFPLTLPHYSIVSHLPASFDTSKQFKAFLITCTS